MVHLLVVIVLVLSPWNRLEGLYEGLGPGVHLITIQYARSAPEGMHVDRSRRHTDRNPRKMRLSAITGPNEGEVGVMKGDSSSPGAPVNRRCLREENEDEDGGVRSCCEREARSSPTTPTQVNYCFPSSLRSGWRTFLRLPFLSFTPR